MPANYLDLKTYFPAIDNDEVAALLTTLKTKPAFDDIWKLSGARPSELGSTLSTASKTYFTEFWDTLKTESSNLIEGFEPVDPEEPTAEELAFISRLLPDLLLLFSPIKSSALRYAVDSVRKVDPAIPENTYDLFKVIEGMNGASAMAIQSAAMFEAMASYYIATASQYVAARSVKYQFLGQVVDQTNGEGKGKVKVSMTDHAFEPNNRQFGSIFTNDQGYFRIQFSVLDGIKGAYPLSFTFTHDLIADGTLDLDLSYDPDNARIPVRAEIDFIIPESLSEKIVTTGVSVPAAVTTYLNAQSKTIINLEDIRRIGGLANLPLDPTDLTDPALLKLDALASLEIVSKDLSELNTLYDGGFRSLSSIANMPKRHFMQKMGGTLSEFRLAQVHYQAQATQLYALNNLAGAYAPTVGGEAPRSSVVGPANGCGCDDCLSAVSPLAYLADLLNFAQNNLDASPGASVNLPFLQNSFLQDMGLFPARCSTLKEPYCQNRIAAEVLRRYRLTIDPTPEAISAFEDTERRYLQNTYFLLLNQLGTSYEQVRKMRFVVDEERLKRVTDRLGIAQLDAADDETLPQLFVDLSTPANLTESGLQTLFGYRNSNNFSFGPAGESSIAKWKMSRLREIWSEQDGLRNDYWKIGARKVIIDPDVVTIDELRIPNGGAAYLLWMKRYNWTRTTIAALFGTGTGVDEDVQDMFKDQGIIVAYGVEVTIPDPANITYHVGSDDPTNYTILAQYIFEGNTYFRVQESLTDDSYGGILNGGDLADHENTPQPVRQADLMLALLNADALDYDSTAINLDWAEVDAATLVTALRALRTLATSGNSTQVETALQAITDRYFAVASLSRMLELYDKHQEDPLNPNTNGNLTGDEWMEFANILISVLKNKLKENGGVWTIEEDGLTLGPDVFWASINEPETGNWPLDHADGVPLLDPDLVTTVDLPEVTVRVVHQFPVPTVVPTPVEFPSFGGIDFIFNAADLLRARKDELGVVREQLITEHTVEGFGDMLVFAFGIGLTWNPDALPDDYQDLLNNLTDSLTSGLTTRYISNVLKLAPADLQFIVDIGRKDHAEETISKQDMDRVYSLLTEAHKRIVRYPVWITEETATTTANWKLRKAQLPKWRASIEQRNEWLRALAENSEAPIIDADLIGPSDLADPVPTDRAAFLWKQRWETLHGPATGYPNDGTPSWLADVVVSGLTTKGALDAITKVRLGHVESGLDVILVQQDDGVDIRPRIAQLNLTPAEFNQLISYRDILPETEPGNQLTPEEKKDFQRILAQARKRRNFHTHRLEEIEDGITLSQDHFKIRESNVGAFPPEPAHALIPWLASERDLILWRRKLRGRVEQEKSVRKALEDMLFEVEEAMMVHLRDGLAQLCGDPTRSLLENARDLGNKLLIDLENNCCYKTNRVAVAIETLQQLLWKTRTGDILHHYPTMDYVGEDFDEAWTWMGSYANWRAAMFVFLYPENVLIPSLRKNQTPAFKEVIQETRNNRRFGPSDACRIARDYRKYLLDVTSLDVKCAAEADVFVRNEGCGEQTTIKPKYTFVFAQSRTSNLPYYSMVDARDKANMEQLNFWKPIPNLDETTRIFGCSVYFPDDEEFIYLFFQKDGEENEAKFFALRFNLLNGQWEDEPLEFQVEIDDLQIVSNAPTTAYAGFKKEDFSPKIKAIAVRQYNHTFTPGIAVSLEKSSGIAPDVYTFYWKLHFNGKEIKPEWKGDGWRMTINGDLTTKGKVQFYQGVYGNPDEGYRELDHSILVLRSSKNYTINPDWQVWHRLKFLTEFHVAMLLSISNSDLNNHQTGQLLETWRISVVSLFGSEQGLHDNIAWVRNNSSIPKFLDNQRTADDVIIYLRPWGGDPGWTDRLYIVPGFEEGQGKEVTALFPFYDNQTVHVEYRQNDTLLQNVLHYVQQTGDSVVPQHVNDPIGSSFPADTKLVAPTRNWFPFEPNVGDQFEPNGGMVIHQNPTDGNRIRISYFGKTYDAVDPVNSTMQVVGPGTNLTPKLDTVPIIHDEFSETELTIRREASHLDLANNNDPNFLLEEYIHEAYYFVPMQIALQLHANGFYQDALDWFRVVYDISRPLPSRKIYYGLVYDASGAVQPTRAADWYSDPLNPHAIASTRPHAYTRYTILAIVYCLLDYADAQYTTDTSETVPRARELYEDAIELLQLLIPADPCPADEAINELMASVGPTPYTTVIAEILAPLTTLSGTAGFTDLVSSIATTLSSSAEMDAKVAAVQTLILTAQENNEPGTVAEIMSSGAAVLNAQIAGALAAEGANDTMMALSQRVAETFSRVVSTVTAQPEANLLEMDLPWFEDDVAGLTVSREYEGDLVNPGHSEVLLTLYNTNPSAGFQINSPFPNIGISGMSFLFCVVPNPIVRALLMKGEVQLWKIHNCMNIAGMVRELDPFAAPTDSTSGIPVIGVGGTLAIPTDRQIPPSAYRYRVIVDRAKQLVAMAQQVESAFLSALEKVDAERYSQLRAEQDIETTKATVKLQDLKVKEANDGVKLAELQRDRSQLQVDGLQGMIDEGLLGTENLLVGLYANLAINKILLLTAKAVQDAANTTVAASGASIPLIGAAAAAALTANIFGGIALGTEFAIAGLESGISITSLYASLDRRKQEWEFQKTLATQDLKIGEQGIKIAQDRVQINGQERAISVIQNDHAKATLDFLKNKFTSAEMYEWMSGVLEDVYAYFLQEATSLALMAQRQLSFERQVDLPPFIRTDYWVVDGGSTGGVDLTGEGAVDRRGITGSSRLLKDLYELDQYAFNTNSPKLQMSKTISLSEIAPEELMRLRDKGIASFFTTEDHFDRDYPGHYLRLIKKVNVTVIALNSPTKGIRATLTNGGTSRVTTGGTIFQKREIKRYPEQIALSGGVGDYGVFQLQGQGEFLDPFEGTGVETQWEFRMEKASNPFNYDSIADVLLTIEYEALNSFIYRNTVTQRLDSEGAFAGLTISMKNNLPDQWFDLHNPGQTSTPNSVKFSISANDLAPNMGEGVQLDRVLVYVAMKNGASLNRSVKLIFENDLSSDKAVNENGIADMTDSALVGNTPIGEWTFNVSQQIGGGVTNDPFTNNLVDDIVIIMNYNGEGIKYLKE